MKWKKYTIETTTEAADFMSPMLMELGIEGVEIEDHVPISKEEQEELFIDYLPELPEDEGISHVSFYLEEDGRDQSRLIGEVKLSLEELRRTVDIGSGVITVSETEDVDWINNWKKYFTSFTVGDILIKPTWEELQEKDQDRLLIEIDPGLSFGTGKHETTQLCIRQLQKYIRGREDFTPGWRAPRVLDVGCGSGILSIAALKLGARAVVGTDVDSDCMISTRDNFQVNHLDASLGSFYVGDLTIDPDLRERVGSDFEIVTANLLADILIPMAPVLFERLLPGGVLIASGVIDFKEQEVCEAFTAAGFAIAEVSCQGEWVGITARRE